MANRVVITSVGMVTSLGSSPDEIIRNILDDRVTFARSCDDPETIICPVNDFHLKNHTGRFKDGRYLNRGVKLAVAAAISAVSASKLTQDQCERAGLFVGNGPNMDITGEFPEISQGRIGESTLPALFLLRFLPNTTASAISKIVGIHGENLSVGSACSASMMAMGEAFRKIKDGYLDMAFAGGGDSRLSQVGQMAYRKAQALSQKSGDPTAAYAPFDRHRDGFVSGEGGGFVLLENLDHALDRNASILGEIRGYGATMDGYTMTAPNPDGHFAELAIRRALSEAGLTPADVDLISAHGTGTVLNDQMEADMIRRIYDGHRPAVMALKSWVGHLASSCGAVELALTLSCLSRNLFPGIRNLREPLCDDLNFLTAPSPLNPRVLMFQNFGFGGQNSALVVSPWKP